MANVTRFPTERVESPSGEYYCSRHAECKGPSLPGDHDTFCDLGKGCDHHWEPCEFCVAVELLDMIADQKRRDAVAKGDKEKIRLLRILAKEKAELEWPCRNRDLQELVQTGHVARIRDYTSHWGGREHAMTTLTITDAGREILAHQ